MQGSGQVSFFSHMSIQLFQHHLWKEFFFQIDYFDWYYDVRVSLKFGLIFAIRFWRMVMWLFHHFHKHFRLSLPISAKIPDEEGTLNMVEQ